MDEWSKKKKAASNGGRGMCKYIDYEEQKRLSRLKNIRGSVNQSMQHNSWQASQLEKRRKEQIRQRKREAKKRAEKKEFQVDTGCAATPYAFTKCGLKLRLDKSKAPEKSRTEAKREANTDKPVSKQLPLVSQYAIDSIELNRRKPAPSQKNVTKRKEDIKLNKHSGGGLEVGPDAGRATNSKKKDINTKSNAVTQKQAKEDSNKSSNLVRDNTRSSNSNSSSSEGKENGDNPNRSNESKNENAEAKQTLTKGKLFLHKKQPMKKSTDSYFMDFESLKREHADAIEMLKQLDEENKRLFVRKDGGVLDLDAEWTKEEEDDDINEDAVEKSLAVTLPEGMLHATHLSISLHDIEDNDLQDDREVGTKPEAEVGNELDDELCDELDDESEAEHSYSNSCRSKQEVDDEYEEEEDDDDLEDSEDGGDTEVLLH